MFRCYKSSSWEHILIVKNFISLLKTTLLWSPFLIFFLILITMLTSDFKNPTDEYFVSTVLRSCLILLGATFVAHILCIGFLMLLSSFKMAGSFGQIENVVKTLVALPIVDIGMYSVALFVAQPEFGFWLHSLVLLLLLPTLSYWLLFLKGPIRNLHQFALFHQVQQRRITKVLSSFYIAAYVDYFFIVLKKSLMPLVFILTVMDYKIMLPKLLDSGMSLAAFIMFFSLILSLQLLTPLTESAQ